MNKNKLVTPEGTKDYLFEEVILRKNIEDKLRNSFQLRGYHEVVTPSLEFLDVYTTMENSIGVEQMYKLIDSKGRLMVLRPDSTMPIARLCATRLKQEQVPLRLYYNQPVFSVNRSLRGRSDEIMQTGIELIGISNSKADMEVLVTAMNALKDLGIDRFRMELGHIGIFNSLIGALQISTEEKERIRQLVQSKNYPALQDTLDQMEASEEREVLKILPRLFGGKEVLEELTSMISDSEILKLLNYLKNLYQFLEGLGMKDKISVDLGIVSRTDYYTGIVFKGFVEGSGEEILSGGRYDTLLGEFGKDWGAVGFGVNVDAVCTALNHVKEQEFSIQPAAVLVYGEAGYEIAALEYIEILVQRGIVSEYSLADSKDDAVRYAKEKHIGRVDIVADSIEIMNL